MKKRILSILLVLCMMLAMVPILPLTASASGGQRQPTLGSAEVSVTGGFTVRGDEFGYEYDQVNGVLTVKHGAMLQIANTDRIRRRHIGSWSKRMR